MAIIRQTEITLSFRMISMTFMNTKPITNISHTRAQLPTIDIAFLRMKSEIYYLEIMEWFIRSMIIRKSCCKKIDLIIQALFED